jgi:hypothetical protein
MQPNGNGSPVTYPTVTIGAETLTVKIDLFAELVISRAGLSLSEGISPLQAGNKDPQHFYRLMQLFSAATAHNYKRNGLPIPDAEEWVAKIEAAGGDPELNSPIIQKMRAALVEAVVKRWPSLRQVPVDAAKLKEPAQPEEPKAN